MAGPLHVHGVVLEILQVRLAEVRVEAELRLIDAVGPNGGKGPTEAAPNLNALLSYTQFLLPTCSSPSAHSSGIGSSGIPKVIEPLAE